MKTAVIFPGQGSQYIGMGLDFYEKYQTSKETFEALDNTLSKNITKLIFSGDISDLSQTENSQPAIMATSIAILNALISEKLISYNSYQAVAGHSLGEYTALVANKSILFEEAVRLLQIRSMAMQNSMPIGTSGMIALIGCTAEVIKNTLNHASKVGQIYIANDNAEGQTVLSGEIEAINFVLSNSKELQIRKAIKLPVSASFHCSLMSHAATVLEDEIKKVNFRKFRVPLFSNVTSKPCNEREISDLLVKQVVSKVRWREIVENMIFNNFTQFIEIGPGNVLSNLVKRISKNVKVCSVNDLSDLEKLNNFNL